VTGQPHWLVQDNAPCHAAKATLAQFQEWGIKYMDHPPSSPDLNLAENPIGQIKYNLKNRRHHRPTNLVELRAALTWEWDTYPQAKLAHLVTRFPDRLRAVKAANGGPTRY
jgi:DDE superfamily endonuclease